VRISALLPQGGAVPVDDWPFEGLASRLVAHSRAIAELDAPRLVASLAEQKKKGTPPGELTGPASEGVKKHRKDVDALLALAPEVLTPESIPIAQKSELYRTIAPLMHLDAACAILGVPFATQAADSLPDAFRPSLKEPAGWKSWKKTQVKAGYNISPAGSYTNVLDGATGILSKSEDKLTFRLKDVASARRAAIHLPVTDFSKSPDKFVELVFEVTINGHFTLLMRYDMRTAIDGPRKGLWHTFDPRALADGANEVVVRLVQTPGLSGPLGEAPLPHVELGLAY
jgi:hypothetical protein